MTPKQLYDACRTLAPNFRVCIEYTTLPTLQRVLVWRGRKPQDMEEQSAGTPFSEESAFEPKFLFVLQGALAVLSRP